MQAFKIIVILALLVVVLTPICTSTAVQWQQPRLELSWQNGLHYILDLFKKVRNKFFGFPLEKPIKYKTYRKPTVYTWVKEKFVEQPHVDWFDENALVDKAKIGDVTALKEILTQRPDIQMDFLNHLPFRTAASNGHIDAVELILDHSEANAIHAKNGEALRMACKRGDDRMVQYLLSRTPSARVDYNDGEPLKLAAQYGHLNVLKTLLTKRPPAYVGINDIQVLTLPVSLKFINHINESLSHDTLYSISSIYGAAQLHYLQPLQELLDLIPISSNDTMINDLIKEDVNYKTIFWAARNGLESILHLTLLTFWEEPDHMNIIKTIFIVCQTSFKMVQTVLNLVPKDAALNIWKTFDVLWKFDHREAMRSILVAHMLGDDYDNDTFEAIKLDVKNNNFHTVESYFNNLHQKDPVRACSQSNILLQCAVNEYNCDAFDLLMSYSQQTTMPYKDIRRMCWAAENNNLALLTSILHLTPLTLDKLTLSVLKRISDNGNMDMFDAILAHLDDKSRDWVQDSPNWETFIRSEIKLNLQMLTQTRSPLQRQYFEGALITELTADFWTSHSHLDLYRRVLKVDPSHLFSQELDIGHTLLWAARYNHTHVVQNLLQNRYGIGSHEVRDAVQVAARFGNLEVVDLILQSQVSVNIDANNDQALNSAVWNGHYDVVTRLLRNSANGSTSQGLPLRLAIMRGNIPVLEAILYNTKRTTHQYELKKCIGLSWKMNWPDVTTVLLTQYYSNRHGTNRFDLNLLRQKFKELSSDLNDIVMSYEEDHLPIIVQLIKSGVRRQ